MKRVWHWMKMVYFALLFLSAGAAFMAATFAWFTANEKVETSRVTSRTGSTQLELQISRENFSPSAGGEVALKAPTNALMPVSTNDLSSFVYCPLTNDGYAQRFLPAEAPLYRALRQSIPIIDAALQKIVRLTVDFTLTAAEPEAQPLLSRFAAEVPVGASGRGLAAFAGQYLDSLLCYGSAVGEVVLDHDREKLLGLYLPPLSHLSFQQGSSPLEAVICTGEGRDRRPLPCPELILFTALHPAPGEITGQSLLSGLPAVSRVLLQIYSAIGKNFERMGNLRYAVTYRPTPGDGTDAAAVANEISREWSAAMQAAAEGEIRDFVAVGDVDIRVIGADNQFIATEVPVRQLLEQIVAKLGLPPFLLGLSWSSTERMSSQQSDLLTGELESYRRLLTPVLARIAGLYLRSQGFSPEVAVEWAPISLQDETEEATARLTRAKAEELERKLAREAKQEGKA